MTKKIEYDEEGREGLVKVPAKVLLREALIENGKLKAYIDELEHEVKKRDAEILAIRHEMNKDKRKLTIVELTYNGEPLIVPIERKEWNGILGGLQRDAELKEYRRVNKEYKDKYRRIYNMWKIFLNKHCMNEKDVEFFPEAPKD